MIRASPSFEADIRYDLMKVRELAKLVI